MTTKQFKQAIWQYYHTNGRDLPWRRAINPYRIVVSEIMLQQTQVSRVLIKYPIFIKRFPDFQALAHASIKTVLGAWQGLGYNRRALSLKKLSEIIVQQYNGKLPNNPETLTALPGIGKATAGSICAFAFNMPIPFIETNIRRVFINHFFPNQKQVSDKEILPLVAATLPHKRTRACPPKCSYRREWFWALMDYGTMLATQIPNPNRSSAHYKKQSRFEGSNRQLRGAILKILIAKKSATCATLSKTLSRDVNTIKLICNQLTKEGLLQKRGSSYLIS